MRYYIVNNEGNVLGDFDNLNVAKSHLELYSDEQIEEEEIEIIEGE